MDVKQSTTRQTNMFENLQTILDNLIKLDYEVSNYKGPYKKTSEYKMVRNKIKDILDDMKSLTTRRVVEKFYPEPKE